MMMIASWCFATGRGMGASMSRICGRLTLMKVSKTIHPAEGDTWYLVQSKYGTAFQGHATVIEEGRKVIATLCGENQRLSQNVRDLMEQLTLFREKASERDRIVLVFATEMPMSETDRQALDDVRVIGRERLTSLFDVLDVSLYNLWDVDPPDEPSLSLTLKGDFVDVDSSLRVGTVSLTNLVRFFEIIPRQDRRP